MNPRSIHDHVALHVRTDIIQFTAAIEVESVLNHIRKRNISDQIVYLYVVDDLGLLVGVVPLRRLISASPEQHIGEIMLSNVVTISDNDTLAHAHKIFSKYKYLSLPVVDGCKKFLGVLDINVLTGTALNPDKKQRFDDIFETIGIRSSYLSYLTPFSAFKHRFPWLVPTIVTGSMCAVMSTFFEKTISESIILTFFLTLVLGLGESVSIQTLTITIRQLHLERPTLKWFKSALLREMVTALALGTSTGAVIAILIFFWKHSLISGIAVGLSILLSLVFACFFGLIIPTLIHKTRLDPKVSAGPVALGLSDLFTLLLYFSVAYWLL